MEKAFSKLIIILHFIFTLFNGWISLFYPFSSLVAGIVVFSEWKSKIKTLPYLQLPMGLIPIIPSINAIRFFLLVDYGGISFILIFSIINLLFAVVFSISGLIGIININKKIK